MNGEFEPSTRRRDTSWVQGELATAFENFPTGGLQRLSLDSRYYLTTPEDFDHIVAEDALSHRYYRRGKFDCENFAFAFKSICDGRYGLNSVGVLLDYRTRDTYNVVVYEEGGVDVFDPDASELIVAGGIGMESAYKIDLGVIIL